jgi:hypothetical protein
VAGFDLGFQCDPRDVRLLRGLVPLMRTRARKFRVRWHFELDDEGLGYITLDGHWAALDLFLERLQRDLPTAAEALGNWRQPPPAAGWHSASCARCRAGATTGGTAATTRSGCASRRGRTRP